MIAATIRLDLPADYPSVILLDAREAGLDEQGLREAMRVRARKIDAHTSRSYRYPYGLLAWHGEKVGVDIERTEPLGERFAESICTPREHKLGLARSREAASLWCSKEALAKALGDALQYDPRRLDSPILWPDGRSGPWRAATIPVPGGHHAWLCWRAI